MNRSRSLQLVLLDQALVSAANFATTIVLVRWMGLESFGEFSLIWMLVLFAIGLQQACISQPLMTIGPKQTSEDEAAYYASAFWLELGFSAVLFVLCWSGCATIAAVLDHDVLRLAALPISVLVCAKQAHGFVRSSFFARERRAAVLWNDALAYVGQLALLLYVGVNHELHLAAALWCLAIPSLLAFLLGCTIYGSLRVSAAQVQSSIRRHWDFSRWLVAKAVLQWFSSNYFLLAAGALLGTASLGAVKAAQTVLGLLHVFFLAMENTVPVHAARIHLQRGTTALLRYMERLALVGTLFTLVISGTVMAWPDLLLELVYGEATEELVLALRGMAILYVFVFEVAVLSLLFRTLERTRPIFMAFAGTAVLSFLSAYPLVEAFGLYGVVGGMIGQQVLMATFLLLSLRASMRMQPAR